MLLRYFVVLTLATHAAYLQETDTVYCNDYEIPRPNFRNECIKAREQFDATPQSGTGVAISDGRTVTVPGCKMSITQKNGGGAKFVLKKERLKKALENYQRICRYDEPGEFEMVRILPAQYDDRTMYVELSKS